MKKKIVSIIVIVVVSLFISFSANIFAMDEPEEFSSFTDGFKYIINPDGKSCTITGYTLGVYTNIIPDKIDGYTVTAIGDNAFINISRFAGEITLPDAVTSIGSNAFSHCGTLTGIHLGKNIKYLGDKCFNTCIELKVITGLERVEVFGNEVFIGCSNLVIETSLDKVKKMGSKVFTDAFVKRIDITPNNAPDIENDTFDRIEKKVYIPMDGVGYVGTGWGGTKVDRFLLGDLDENGVINGTDASIVLDIYNKNSKPSADIFARADMNRDGVINGTDASMILDIYNKGL